MKLELARNFANKLVERGPLRPGRPAGRDSPPMRTLPAIEADLGPIGALDPLASGRDDRRCRRGIAEYQFSEVTRGAPRRDLVGVLRLGDRACQVRLADESVPAADRAANLVDARRRARIATSASCTPLMPFVTEAIWAALPRAADDSDLLIRRVLDRRGWSRARGSTPDWRRSIDTIVAIRNARADGRPAGGRLAGDAMLVPGGAFEDFERCPRRSPA